jgi:hypothetical protein
VTTTLVHAISEYAELLHGDQPIFRYVYGPATEPRESPKPYFHPLYTLGGELVSVFRPHDHVWHKGLAMTWAVLSGQNFWGGPTYVHGQGYVQLDNNGQIVHRGWDELRADAEQVVLAERLDWIASTGQTWLAENRRIAVAELDPTRRLWSLDFEIALRNVAGRVLTFGSPTTEGRPLAGYGGLFWRGPRSFTGGKILAAEGLEGPELMGKAAAWLAFVGRHDGSGGASTLVFLDRPGNPRYPTKWFVRSEPFAAVSFAFAFDEELDLAIGDALHLRYRVAIADGAWSRKEIEEYVGAVG